MDAQTMATSVSPLQATLVGGVLMVVWKLLDVAKQLFLANKSVPANGIPQMSPLACQTDPQHFQHVKEVHRNSERLKSQINRGDLDCQWKDREEVRDYIDITKRQVTATESMVDEMRLLRQELVLARSGKT